MSQRKKVQSDMNEMTKQQFWKNFNIGREVQLSGNFIYDGLLVFEQMEHFYNEDEIFEFLYFLSVGLERLLKANVVLIEHSEDINQQELEASLITHNHADLIRRIEKKHQLNLGKVHKEFIQLLTFFYKSIRYDRFNIDNYRNYEKEKNLFVNFINKHLDVTINNDFIIVTPNDKKYKRFIGKIVGKLTSSLYEILREEAYRLNLYTYEIRTYSKAYKIFMEANFTFENERILQKEILVFLIQNKNNAGFMKHIESNLPPIEFENGSENYYAKGLFDLTKCSEYLEELEARYEELDDKKHRFAAIDVIGNENIDLDDAYDDDEI